MSDAYWFSPAPSEVMCSRLSLDFNLRAADLFFREMIVPELGRIWFVRQLSWPLAALALHMEMGNGPRPTAICHGIEALACKLEFWANPNSPSPRVLGRRAFGRDAEQDVWSFHQLRQPAHYVRNTHRQAATRAIRADGGLGFARGSRFDLLELEPVGRKIAENFLEQRVGQGRMSLRKWLRGWLEDHQGVPSHPKALLQALSPERATVAERELVYSRLVGRSTPAGEKRKRLAHALGRAENLKSIGGDGGVVDCLRKAGHSEQANEIVVARAFGTMLDRARDTVAILTHAVELGRGGVKLANLARDSALKKSIKDLRTTSKNYVGKVNELNAVAIKGVATSRDFSNAVVAGEDMEAIRILVERCGKLLGLADGVVTRGPLFRVVDATDEGSALEDGVASIEPDGTGRTFRIANFHSLLRDAERRGAL
jgi:hypothetical protein